MVTMQRKEDREKEDCAPEAQKKWRAGDRWSQHGKGKRRSTEAEKKDEVMEDGDEI